MVVDPSEDPRTRTSDAPSYLSDDPSWWKLGSVFGRFVAVPRSRVDGALKPHPREADTAGDGAAAASRLSLPASGARAHARARGGGTRPRRRGRGRGRGRPGRAGRGRRERRAEPGPPQALRALDRRRPAPDPRG